MDVMQRFAAEGVAVFAVRADAAEPASMSAVLQWIHERLPALGHVVHAAGVSGHSMLQDMADADLWDVAKPKVSGMYIIDWDA